MRTASFTEVLRGHGVHRGQPAVLTLEAADDPSAPVSLRVAGELVPVARLAQGEGARSTNVSAGGVRLGTVEHLFAALAGLSLHRGVVIELVGPEVPLLDGGARSFVEALERLPVKPSRSSLVVARDGTVAVGESRYEFASGAGTHVAVTLDYPGAPLDPVASWAGDAADFRARIAPARTFALEAELEALGAQSLARFAESTSVVVVGSKLHGAGEVRPDEPARHKLLDLVGDAFLHGGPPRGSMRVFRPGHASNHAALRTAIARGILARDPS
jgi:UDP-3-O-[3-hydroxymyristoyl] N-acetylglucosamine deacetylase